MWTCENGDNTVATLDSIESRQYLRQIFFAQVARDAQEIVFETASEKSLSLPDESYAVTTKKYVPAGRCSMT